MNHFKQVNPKNNRHSISVAKKKLRNAMIAKRDSIPDEKRKLKSLIIERKLRAHVFYQNADVIMTYVSFNSEVDTHSIIKNALDNGKRIVVPVSIPEGRLLLPCEITSLDDLKPGTWGILEPAKEKRIIIEPKKIDLVIIPGIAFDSYKNRLGYGAGYYDRFLPSLRHDAVKVGIGFIEQIVDILPVEPFDVSLDMIVTDGRCV
ncbi:MAG: 5-formyltetrahydrofolate cyclo-ligase [Caldicoprobacterales bacterium]